MVDSMLILAFSLHSCAYCCRDAHETDDLAHVLVVVSTRDIE